MKPSQEASTSGWDKAGASMKRATRRGSAGTPYLPRIGKVAHRYRYELEYLALVLTPPGQGLPGLRLLPAPSVFAAPGGTRQRGGAYRYSGLGSRYNGAPFSVRAATSLAALAGFVGGRKVQWPLCWVRYSYLVAAAKVPVQHSTGPLLASPTGPADATERLVCQCTPLGIPQAGA
ncbi:hypothetical protein Trisim1_007929 [Trichoderma cf. simile WF8]